MCNALRKLNPSHDYWHTGETQIDSVESVVVLSTGNPLPTPVEFKLLDVTDSTLSDDDNYQPDLEAFEGMLVTFPEALTLVETFQCTLNHMYLYAEHFLVKNPHQFRVYMIQWIVSMKSSYRQENVRTASHSSTHPMRSPLMHTLKKMDAVASPMMMVWKFRTST